MGLGYIGDSLSIVIKYLDVDSIHNLEKVSPYIYNYINTRKRYITETILNNYGWKLFIIDNKKDKYISVWRDNYCVSFLPDIIDNNNWDYIIRHMFDYTPMNCIHELINTKNIYVPTSCIIS